MDSADPRSLINEVAQDLAAADGDSIAEALRTARSRLLVSLVLNEENVSPVALSRVRAQRRTAPPWQRDLWSEVEEMLQIALTQQRLDAERSTIRAEEKQEPLRYNLLMLLSEGPSTPTELAKNTGSRPEVISRLLRSLSLESLVAVSEDPLDRRRRIYSITEAGAVVLGKFRALVQAHTPSEVGVEADRSFLMSALNAAVERRRYANDSTYSVARLNGVLSRATELRDSALSLRAHRELATTYRQLGDWPSAEAHCAALEEAATGTGLEPAESHLVLPALSYYWYERGRCTNISIGERLRHLSSSADACRELQRLESNLDDWHLREAWALVSTSDLFVNSTQLGLGLNYAQAALHIFEAREDFYGAATASFLAGFCLRQRADLDLARTHLDRSLALATQYSFDRCRANALLQLGEVERYLCHGSNAFDLLTEACDLASGLSMPVTHGFALSSLSATAFQLGDLDLAYGHGKSASQVFKMASHQRGFALNARRLGVVLRELATGNSRRRKRLMEQAERAFSHSLAFYRANASPAGVAACVVGVTRLHNTLEQQVPDEMDIMRGVARDPQMLLLFSLDPWAPNLLSRLNSELPGSGIPGFMMDIAHQHSFPGEDEMAGEPRFFAPDPEFRLISPEVQTSNN